MMDYYKDFNYLQYMLNLSFDDGFNLYLKCLLNIKQSHENKIEDRYFKIWLLLLEKGQAKYDFKEFLENAKKETEIQELGYDFRNTEEQRIIDKIVNKKPKKLKRVM